MYSQHWKLLQKDFTLWSSPRVLLSSSKTRDRNLPEFCLASLIKVNHLDVPRCWQVEPLQSVVHHGWNMSRGLVFSWGSLACTAAEWSAGIVYVQTNWAAWWSPGNHQQLLNQKLQMGPTVFVVLSPPGDPHLRTTQHSMVTAVGKLTGFCILSLAKCLWDSEGLSRVRVSAYWCTSVAASDSPHEGEIIYVINIYKYYTNKDCISILVYIIMCKS